ncbi:SDR family oxidoreductase [Streptomyces sp. NPDC090445]|uniref:SDR family oxidoreductase n=1 Tax=Streptomyces sp. NPDC090445 TaxID=3365963 RepID=UPI003825AC51
MAADEFAGKAAVVTGARGGIGSVVVRRLADLGASVVAVDRTPGPKAGTAQGNGTVVELVADVTRPDEVRGLVRRAEEAAGPLDFLVNAAGVLHSGPVSDCTVEEWQETFAVNALGVFMMSQAAAAGMVERGRGAIVTVASNAARIARTGMAAYAASKAAATAFTRCLGLELAPHGVRCNVVAPGSTDTPMLTGLWEDAEEARRLSVQGLASGYRPGIPTGRVAEAEDVADAVVFLLSDRARQITLQTLVVDGGASL